MSEPENKPQYITLQKITVNYVAEEDRLRLTASAGDNGTVVYWLTRRMLGVLLTPLFDWLGKRISKNFGLESGSMLEQRSQEARLAMAQSAAQAKMQKEDPVIAQTDSVELVLKSVDVRAEENRFLILLPIDDMHRGIIPFEQESLLQWLAILFRIQREGDWKLAQWPQWFVENQNLDEKRDTPQRALH